MAGTSYDALQTKKQDLIRKARKGSVFVAPRSVVDIATLTDTSDKLLKTLPVGYVDLGWLNEDGASYSTDIETADVTSWGSATPTRSDITSESIELSISCQETRLETIGLMVGVDSSGAWKTSAANSEVKVAKPIQPVKQARRLLSLAVDENTAGEIYIARYWPNAEVTGKDDQAFSSGDDPLMWPITFAARPDSVAGYTECWFFGGPGWDNILTSMGFTKGT